MFFEHQNNNNWYSVDAAANQLTFGSGYVVVALYSFHLFTLYATARAQPQERLLYLIIVFNYSILIGAPQMRRFFE